ncbi:MULTISPECIES: serine hydrolase domain-containing protein [unclassified Saccharopolyspora]|uniref:serine hydrolase domain-containing protein n=1 Tax=unclassified Saccharopolyspora TaxID=2646250 RepID=UPI001CD4B98A|nr:MULTISPECIES: serine hydrolase domain-containing protein [unclassified Saccharopolyspora]MCA1185959.1 beta-lactamase family protein [Saccharopolyspora sp. 6T]MCA1192859.1 beta-lactamase family protein [Saccharopolyspora sp. 6V]MCA1280749.1 beta-lactamase family protein [Saccharopolyspora sp. 7B]
MSTTTGSCNERFGRLQEEFAHRLETGHELGAALAVRVEGESVVDLHGGWADAVRATPWRADTLVCVCSTTKTVIALAALLLADREELDLDAPVSRYWPEFAAEQKDMIKVRHLLSHTSGLSGWQQPIALPDVYDWDTSTTRLATQAPWWEPGSTSGYHVITFGHLIGEVIRRITGMRPGEFVARELAAPLGADFHIGLDPAEFHRVAELIPPAQPDVTSMPDPDGIQARSYTGPFPDFSQFADERFRCAEIPAGNGHGTAEALARLQSIVSNRGSLGGRRLLGPHTLDRIFDVQSNGTDLVLGVPLRFGIGYALPCEATFPFIPDRRICFWFGAGGSFAVNDLDRRVTITYVMNQMHPGLVSPNAAAYLTAAFEALDQL